MELIHKLKIKDLELNNNVVLGPMAGITDKAFRIICKKYNPSLVFTEMVSAKAILYDDKKTKLLMDLEDEEKPIAIQIFGSDLEAIEYAVKYINNNTKASLIDINMGCPVPKIVKNGEGSKLLTEPKLLGEIVRKAVESSKLPISVKIRSGWDEKSINAPEIAKIIENEGASLLTIHGRTRSQFYSGKANWDIIKKVKESVNIPVIGNGDIDSKEIAYENLEKYGTDGIMIARATLGNPWIFREILTGQKEVTNKEKLETMLTHIDLEIKYKGEYTGIRELRPHLCSYIKGIEGASEARQTINHIEDSKELKEYIKSIIK